MLLVAPCTSPSHIKDSTASVTAASRIPFPNDMRLARRHLPDSYTLPPDIQFSQIVTADQVVALTGITSPFISPFHLTIPTPSPIPQSQLSTSIKPFLLSLPSPLPYQHNPVSMPRGGALTKPGNPGYDANSPKIHRSITQIHKTHSTN